MLEATTVPAVGIPEHAGGGVNVILILGRFPCVAILVAPVNAALFEFPPTLLATNEVFQVNAPVVGLPATAEISQSVRISNAPPL